jgi:hypothetical protein
MRRFRDHAANLFGLLGACCALVVTPAIACASPSSETIEQAICRLIEASASSHQVSVEYLTRLIWQESSFRTGVVSRAGAQGVAQFMPGTAAERQLLDPFDPEQAIPKAAEFIAELTVRFGNQGLAAAAYNGGPARVSSWLASERDLAPETKRYVYIVTGRSADEWAAARLREIPGKPEEGLSCLQVTAALRRPGDVESSEAPIAPWGVQLAGNFSKERALRTFTRARDTYASVLEDVQPMVIGTRLRSRGTRAFYRVRVPAASREIANRMCERIRLLRGSCLVLPS